MKPRAHTQELFSGFGASVALTRLGPPASEGGRYKTEEGRERESPWRRAGLLR
jgi:hypothetical protein